MDDGRVILKIESEGSNPSTPDNSNWVDHRPAPPQGIVTNEGNVVYQVYNDPNKPRRSLASIMRERREAERTESPKPQQIQDTTEINSEEDFANRNESVTASDKETVYESLFAKKGKKKTEPEKSALDQIVDAELVDSPTEEIVTAELADSGSREVLEVLTGVLGRATGIDLSGLVGAVSGASGGGGSPWAGLFSGGSWGAGGGGGIPPIGPLSNLANFAGGAGAGGIIGGLAMAAPILDAVLLASIVNNVVTGLFDAGLQSAAGFVSSPRGGFDPVQGYLSTAKSATGWSDPLDQLTGGWINVNPLDDILESLIEATSTLVEGFDNLAETLERTGLSADVNVAVANKSMRELETELYRADMLGSSSADYIDVRSRMDENLERLKILAESKLLPVVNFMLERLATIIELITRGVEISTTVVGTVVSWHPAIIAITKLWELGTFAWNKVVSWYNKLPEWLRGKDEESAIEREIREFTSLDSYDPKTPPYGSIPPGKKRKRR